MDFTPPRGTQDFMPPAGSRLRALYDRATAAARLYGFRYVETPEFERTELIHRTAGESSDVVSKETYTFLDRGGRSLTLRPEGTAPVVRAYLAHQHDLPSPFKAYYLCRMFRYGRPQAARYREHRQFGVEVIGAAEPSADVEVIAVGNRFLRDLDLSRFEVQVNSVGDQTCRPPYRELLVAHLREHREELRDEHRDRFEQNPLRVLDCKDEACRAVSAGAPKLVDHLCDPCREHFDAVLRGLKEEGIDAVVSPSVVRGLDFYTRTAFEFVSHVLSQAQATLFGGGRYDGLSEAIGGPSVPGVGFGMGLERVMLALEDEGRPVPEEPGLEVFVVAVGEAASEASGERLRQLRSAGIRAAGSFGARALGAQMKAADRSGARFAMIIGDREVASNTVTWRRLADGVQFEGSMDEALAGIQGTPESAR